MRTNFSTQKISFKFLCLTLFSALLCLKSFAQYNISVGPATRQNSNATFPCPFQDTLQGSRAQYLYRASELKALGMDSGTINSVTFTVTKMNGHFGFIEDFTVKMGTTTLAALGTNWVGGLTTVYTNPFFKVQLGKDTVTFNIPYDWDGVNNLVLEICNGSSTGQGSGNPSVTQMVTTFNSSRSFRIGGAGNQCSTNSTVVNDSSQRVRPVTIFNWQPKKYCGEPGSPPITVGNIVASANPICPSIPLTLVSTGGTYAAFLVYQWQFIDPLTGNWTDTDPFDIGLDITKYQDTTTTYRLRAVCAVTGDTSYSNVLTVVTPKVPGGNQYIINKNHTGNVWPLSDTFKSFNATYTAMNCGIKSAVTFTVLPGSGPYNEQLNINGKIINSSAINTITYKGNYEQISFNPTATNKAVIKLKNTKYFTFDSLTVNASAATTNAIGFQLQSNADSNEISNCKILLPTSGAVYTTNTASAGIVVGGTDASAIGLDPNSGCDFNTIRKDSIVGGASGIVVAGGAGGENTFTKVEDNYIRNFYQHGIYVNGTYNTTVEHNLMHRKEATVSAPIVNGVYVINLNRTMKILRNRIHSPFSSMKTTTNGFNGINLDLANAGTSPAAADEFFVVNNLVHNVLGNGAQAGINNNNTSNVQIYHNTVSLDDDLGNPTLAGSTTRCYNQLQTPNSISLVNNIFTVTRGGTSNKHTIFINSALIGNFKTLANNNYIMDAAGGTNNFIGFWVANRATIGDWITASTETNALNIQPVYAQPIVPNFDTANLRPTNAIIDDKAKPFYDNIDINGTTTSRNDLGCYEFIPPPCIPTNLNGKTEIYINNKKVVGDTTVCENIPTAFKLKITGATGSQTVYQWEKTLDTMSGINSDFGVPLIQGDTNFLSIAPTPADTCFFYRCKISCTGSNYYTNWRSFCVIPAMITGNYNINLDSTKRYLPGADGGMFKNYTEAVAAMRFCGIKGSGAVVKFNVQQAAAGNYKEQILIDSIRGILPTRQVVFKGNMTTIEFPASGPAASNDRSIFKLKRALYINFDSITVDASKATSYGYGFQLITNSDSNSITNCKIIADTVQTSASFAGIVVNATDAGLTATGNTLCDENKFNNNTIIGGAYGMTLVGSGTALLSKNEIKNNKFLDFNTGGLYIAGTRNTIVESNYFERPKRINVGNTIGLTYTGASSTSNIISKNRFTNFFGSNPNASATASGISFNNIDAAANSENIVINNAIYNLGGTGILNGIINNGSDFVKYYHNTICIKDSVPSNAINAGFFQTTAATSIDFKNNMIAVDRKGNGNKYAIQLATTGAGGTTITSDNNNLFSTSQTGFFGSARKTLNDWKVASSLDVNSLAYEPLFLNITSGDLTPQFYLLDNKALPALAINDINNITRPATPDMGAFEFAAPPCANPLLAGTAVITPNGNFCLEEKINLNLTGNSPLGSIKFQWQDSPDGTTDWKNLGPEIYNPSYDTVTSIRNFYRCIVTCALNNNSVISTVVSSNLNNLLPAGTYTIDSTLPCSSAPYTPGDNFIDFACAINAMSCGIRGNIFFDVKPGATNTYTEQVTIPHIKGSGPQAIVTFRGFNNNAAGTILQYAGTATKNYVLRFDSCSYINFQDLKIVNTNAVNGRVVDFNNKASNINLKNNDIITPNVTVSSLATPANAAVYADQFRGKNIVIEGNTIKGGSNGIFFAGTTPTANNLTAKGHKIIGNSISEAYGHGIHVQFTDKLTVNYNKVNLNIVTANNTAGIFASTCDSGFVLNYNKVRINNQTTAVTGIQVISSRNRKVTGFGYFDGNEVYADSNNTAKVIGMSFTTSDSIKVRNNVISINSGGKASYGLVNTNIVAGSIAHYHNNSIQMNTNDTSSVAGYFVQTPVGRFESYNNIFSNIGYGKALFMNPTGGFKSDYNMLYSNGKNIAQNGTTPANYFQNIRLWRRGTNIDKWSIAYQPAFVSPQDLHPDVNNANVWAIHGRGNQIKGFTNDINNNYRPDDLLLGVPDLGAYEFYPKVDPPMLPAIPATPTANTEQTFYFGSDTVMKIKWDNNAPATFDVQRFSGVVDTLLGKQGRDDSMFFYVRTTLPGKIGKADMKLFYIDPWLGSIPGPKYNTYQLGMGATNSNNVWSSLFLSRNNVSKRMITQNDITYFDRFTGLFNQFAPPKRGCDDTSNAGTEFYVPYTANQLQGGEVFQLYLVGHPTEQSFVEIYFGGPDGRLWWSGNLPAATVNASLIVPVVERKDASGTHNNAIYIKSEEQIVAYAHCSGSASSGATMLMPNCTWGYEYRQLGKHQQWGGTFSSYAVVAKEDNTRFTTNNIVPTQGVPQIDDVVLNKGEWYQVLAVGDNDLAGSVIKSIANSNGVCVPFAVFSGDTRTSNSQPCGGGGDFVIQQNFPATTWGKHYLTAPTSLSTSASTYQKNLFRIAFNDPTQKIWINESNSALKTEIYPALGTIPGAGGSAVLGPNVPGKFPALPAYIEFVTDSPLYITSEKRMMISQFFSGACTGVGDPDMVFISPVEQGVRSINFFRNTIQSIDVNVLTLIGSANDVPDICEYNVAGGACIPTTWTHSYNHPQYAGKRIYIKHWPTSAQRQVKVEGDSIFNAITYGLGSVESYVYNAGTNILNFYVPTDPPVNEGCEGGCPTYTCANTKFKVKTRIADIFPDSIRFYLSKIPYLTPNNDYVITNPRIFIVDSSKRSNGDSVWTFEVPNYYVFNQPGTYTLTTRMYSNELEGCDKSLEWQQFIQVLPSPKIDFKVSPSPICPNTLVTFTADSLDPSTLIPARDYTWRSSANSFLYDTIKTRNITKFYPNAINDTVRLRSRTADYCIGDTSHIVVVNPAPVVTLVKDSVHTCSGDSTEIQISNPIPGATYTVFDAPVNGNIVAKGNGIAPIKFFGVTTDSTYYVEAVSAVGCMSDPRKPVKIGVTQLPTAIANPPSKIACVGTSVTFTSNTSTSSSTTNSWFTTSTGGTPFTSGNSATINPVISDSVLYLETTLNGCKSASRFAVNVIAETPPSLALVTSSISICAGENATFNVATPQANVTYNWYTAPTGGTSTTGASYSVNSALNSANYYVSATSLNGCTTSPRLAAALTVISKPIVTIVKDSITICSGTNATYNVLNPIPASNYTIYDAPTGGNVVFASFDGTTPINFNNVTSNTTYYVECVLTSGCISATRKPIYVEVIPIPTVNVTPASQTICIGKDATFNVIAPMANANYSWWDATSGGTQLGTGTSYYVGNVSSNVTIYAEVAVSTCVSATRFAVNIIAAQSPSIAVTSNPVVVCNNDNATLTVQTPDPTVNYNWYAAAIGGNSLSNTTTYTASNLQTNSTYFVDATSTNGCLSNRLPVNINVTQRPIITVINPDSIATCKGYNNTFAIANPITGIQYNWYDAAVGGNIVKNDSSKFTTPAINSNNQLFYVDGTNAGCTSVNRVPVKVTFLPQMDTVTVTGSDIYTNQIIFTWTPTIAGATGYDISVSVNRGTSQTTSYGNTTFTHTVSGLKPGDTARAIVTTKGGNSCQNMSSSSGFGKTVINSTYYPNTFTPNGDGNNDKIVICGNSIKSIQYLVYNQWGEKIWETTTSNSINNCYELWDGRQRGVLQPVGVYMFASRITFLDGKVEEKKGMINLIR